MFAFRKPSGNALASPSREKQGISMVARSTNFTSNAASTHKRADHGAFTMREYDNSMQDYGTF